MTSKKQIFLWKLVSHSCFYTIIWNRLCYSISGLIQISGLIFLCKVWSNNNKNMRLKWHLVIVVVQSLSHVWLFVTPWTAECQAFLSFTISWSLLKLMPIELVMLSNHLIFCHPLLLLLSIFPNIRVFSVSWLFASGGQSIGVSASASVLPMNIHCRFPLELTGLISLLSKGISRVFYSTTVWKHQFFSPLSSLWSNSHIHTWLMQRPQPWIYGPLSVEWYLCFLIYCLGLS